MARTDNLTNFLNDVATSIKTKLNDNTAIPASQFDTKIMSIETVGTYQSKTIPVTTNGSQTITPDQGYDALSSIVINTQVPIPQLQTKSYEFTDNATITLSPETGYDGFSSISLTINVPGSINNQNKTVTQNGTYQADQGYTGLGTVIVNVTDTEYATNLALSQQILGSSALPYIPLEYIESTGTQYIDTNYTPNNGYLIRTVLEFKDFLNTYMITGTYAYNSDEDNRFFIRIDTTTGNLHYQYGNSTKNGQITVQLNTIYTIECRLVQNNQYLKVNDNLTGITYSNLQQPNNTSLLFLGCYNYMDLDADNIMPAKIYSCKYFDNNYNLVRDFIPVKRKSDNEICLYDKVSNTFFTNQGTGNFIAGPVIN